MDVIKKGEGVTKVKTDRKLRWKAVEGSLTVENYRALNKMAFEQFVNLHRLGKDGQPGMINTAGEGDIYEGALFGRDSAIMSIQAVKTAKIFKEMGEEEKAKKLLLMAKDATESLFASQADEKKSTNSIIGAEVGKIIHEKRTMNYEHLIKGYGVLKPFHFEDGVVELYDSVDSTALTMLAAYEYWQETKDNIYLQKYLPNIVAGLNWMVKNGEGNFFAKYRFPRGFTNGRLVSQGLCDSIEFIAQPFTQSEEDFKALIEEGKREKLERVIEVDGKKYILPNDPIAPSEAQGWTWAALQRWGDFLSKDHENIHLENEHFEFSSKLKDHASNLKKAFNEKFIYRDKSGSVSLAQMVCNDTPINVRTGIALSNLWATYKNPEIGQKECIVSSEYLPDLIKGAFSPDLFDDRAGFRTMSTDSPTYNPELYHNGKFWVVINGLIQEGCEQLGYKEEADRVVSALLLPVLASGTSLELCKIDPETGDYLNFFDPQSGQTGCIEQGFSASSILVATAKRLSRS